MTTDATDDKLNFDDISFDDMIDGGLQTAEVSEETVAEKPAQETAPIDEKPIENTSEELDSDAEIKEEIVDDIPSQEEAEVQSKEEPAAEEEEIVDDTVIAEVIKELGYEVGDAEYDDTSEGLAKFTKDVGTKMAQEHIQELMESFPVVKQHLEYVIAGGDSRKFMETFNPQQDYSLLRLSEKDTATQKMLVSNYFKMKGHDQEFIKEIVEDYADSGKLINKAQLAQKALVNAQKEQRHKMMQQQQTEAAERRKEQKNFWNDIYETIDTSKEFSGISVPQNEKKKFFKYLSTPINKEGYTQRDVDHRDSSLDVKLAIDYLMFKGFKLDDIVKNKVSTSRAQSLRSRIQQGEKRIKSARRTNRKNTGFDIEDLDLSVI